MPDKRAIIIGGGHAAAQLGPSLRQQGWQGEILMISDEPHIPYQRPPLSKGYLAGDQQIDDIVIKKASAYETTQVGLKLGTRVEQIDRHNRQVQLNNGERLDYDKLALTLGASVRKLDVPGVDLAGVCYLRTLADLEQIKAQLARPFSPGKKQTQVVIIGGGYIGLETAAVLRKLGVTVTLLEAMPRLLQRVTSEEVSAFYQRIHQEEGVEVLCNKSVTAIEGNDQVQAVSCNDGSTYTADLVIIGIGVIPNTALAAAAGLKTDGAIWVDDLACTSDPNIVAAGDCTTFYSSLYQRNIRLESVPNAMAQATCAAATLCDKPKPYQALPWFWSDQYDLKLQMAGLSQGYEQAIVRGDSTSSRSFSVLYLKNNRLLAVDCINRPRDFMFAKKLIESQNPLDSAALADETLKLQTFIHRD